MDVIVIGGSAGGLKAACRIHRLKPDAHVTVLVKDGHFGYSGCGMPYFLSGDVMGYDELISTASGTIKDQTYFREVKGINVLPHHEATGIDRAARAVHCVDRQSGRKMSFPYDKLVIATGANPLPAVIPGAETTKTSYFTKPDDALRLRKELETGQIESVAVIGGGYIGLELCEAFSVMWGVDVKLIEIRPHVLPRILDVELACLVEEELKRHGVELILGCRCSKIVETDGKVCLHMGDTCAIEADRVVLATGFVPNVELARNAGLDIGRTGGIAVNDHLRTSDQDIYAAGDCVELHSVVDGHAGLWQLGSLASRMGRIIGDNICHGDARFRPVTGANVLKVFDLTLGSAGLTAASCSEDGYDVASSWGTFSDRMHYYPESSYMTGKMVYDRSGGQLLGVQLVSKGTGVHIIDKAAQLLAQKTTIHDVQDMEHAYSPPYSQPFDPLHYLGFIAENSRTSGVKLVSPADFVKLPSNAIILDVRNGDEIEASPLPELPQEIISVPVEELRYRLNSCVPKERPIIAVCEMGSRSWDAAIMLRRAGWNDVSILAGGMHFQPNPNGAA